MPLPPDKYGETPLAEGMMQIINPADWGALEQGLDLSSKDSGSRVTVFALGDAEVKESLRWCLAVGAGRALRIWDAALAGADLLGKGRALAAAIIRGKPDLVLCGDGCLDQLHSALPGVVAAAAGMAYVPGVVKLEKVADGQAVVIRKLEKGKRERVAVKLPAVIAIADSGGAPAYYAGLPETVAAMSATIPCKDLSCLGLSRDRAGARGAKVHSIARRVARPVTAKPATPDPALPAEQRLRKILAGSVVRKQGEIVTGTPEQLADRIVEFLHRQPVVML